jgi:hypothetical protein
VHILLLMCNTGLDAEANVLSVTTQRLWCKLIGASGTTFVGVELLSFIDSRQVHAATAGILL